MRPRSFAPAWTARGGGRPLMTLLFASALAAVLVAALPAPQASAVPTATVSLDMDAEAPGVQAEAEVPQGTPEVRVDVVIENAQAIGAWDLQISYDAASIQFAHWNDGDFLSSTGRLSSCFQIPTQNWIRIGCTTTGATPAGPSGPGLLASLYFTSNIPGHRCLLVSDASTADVFGETLPTVDEDGCFAVVVPVDSDGDGMLDSYEQAHACLDHLTPDAILDADADAVSNIGERDARTDPCAADSDGDTMPDGFELAHACLTPLVPDAAGDPDADALTNVLERAIGTQPCVNDTDGDGCADGEELGPSAFLGGGRNPLSPWDFYDVPVLALSAANPGGVRNRIVNLSDVLAVLAYVGTVDDGAPITGGIDYDSDHNGDGIEDGLAYDRSPGVTGLSGPPNGAVSISDALIAIAQVGHSCSAAP